MPSKTNSSFILAFFIFLMVAGGMFMLNQTISKEIGLLTKEEQTNLTQMSTPSPPPAVRGKPVTIDPATDLLAPVREPPESPEKLQVKKQRPLREKKLRSSVLAQ